MNFGTVKTRMLLAGGNLQSGHPVYTYANNLVNDGLRFMIMRASQKYPNFQLFPEHVDTEWTDVTVADQNYLALPSDSIAIQRVFSLDSSSAPNLNNANWRVVSFIEPQAFDQLTKPTTQQNYPFQYTIREKRIYLWPTPRTGYTTYVKIDGIQDEPDMSSSSDTPRTDARWHPAWLDCASHLLCNDLGYADDATRFLASADLKIEAIGASMIGLRRANIKQNVRVIGTPKGGI